MALMASYYFYMCWNPKYIAMIVASTVITWLSGMILERSSASSQLFRKSIMAVCLVCNMGIFFLNIRNLFLII